MRENYIVLNGKRIDLTEEQIDKLGLKIPVKNMFDRDYENSFYFIGSDGHVWSEGDSLISSGFPDRVYEVANYCADKNIMQQRAFHETLNRLLWRFSMQNDGDKIDWSNRSNKYFITYDYNAKDFKVDYFHTQYGCHLRPFVEYFYTEKIAQKAIDEIVLPFMKEHPKFVL